ncbi:FR47-like protein [Stackebrandtia endophytica]|uniref:FR47-like protein n=1 Tax=Stackebrandtia endophytica TaxID=1496996 RepID=A0A543B3W0_9ACTN|nr:GNAT family N-acetyltransferase [Stackebrandtia endophytica]TQL79525.1 FR47-like protein [Stackebrandtia endophytica]
MVLPPAIHGREALLDAAGDDPLVACFAAEDSVGYIDGDAVVWHRLFHDNRTVHAVGTPDRVAELFARVVPSSNATRYTIPQPVFDAVPRQPRVGGRWHWFYTRTAPAVHEAEDRCGWLTPREYPEVDALLDVAFPTASSRPNTDRELIGWYGARDDDGRLIACGNSNTTAGIGPMLGAIAVHPDARRRGLASGLTSWVTRALLADGHPMVALGSYAGEDATHRIYRRLGYQDIHVLVSGRLDESSN